MLECQIAPYGGNTVWQKLGLQEYPDTSWLILIANKDEDSKVDYVDQANQLKYELEENQKGFPENFKKVINVIDISEFSSDYNKLLQLIMNLFSNIIQKGFTISINGSSGLQLLQIILYQVSLMNKDHVKDYFIFNKRTKYKQLIWLQRDLDENDYLIMNILDDKEWMNVSEIQEKFKECSGKGQISYITKLIQRLSSYGLLIEDKKGREKNVKLKDTGKILISKSDDFKFD
jgi:predicted transcriptional regulator